MNNDIIVIGARGIPNVQGGLEAHAEALFPRFAEKGYVVTFMGIKRYLKSKSYRNVRLLGVNTIDILNSEKVLYNLLGLGYAAIKRPRLVHLQGLNAGLFLVFYRLLGLKVVLYYGSQDYVYPKWGPISRFVLLLCEKQLRFANHVITVSRYYQELLTKKYDIDNVTFVPNGMEVLEDTQNNDEVLARYGLEGQSYVLSVGRITPEKDYLPLIEAVEGPDRDDVCLVIAGGSGDAGYFTQIDSRQGKNIKLLGAVPHEDLAALYKNCSLYVCSSAHEGQSNSVLEAIAYERPLIASDIPANLELGLNSVCYFPVGRADLLKDKIADALNDAQPFVSLDVKGASWNEVFLMTEKIYHEVCPSLRRPLGKA